MFHYSNRSIHFRVQFHRKTGLSLQGCWEGLSRSHARVPACITRWLGWVLIFFFFFFPTLFACCYGVTVMVLHFSWTSKAGSPAAGSPRASKVAGTIDCGAIDKATWAGQQDGALQKSFSMLGHWAVCSSSADGARRSTLISEMLSLSHNQSAHLRVLLPQISSRHASKYCHPTCFVFLWEKTVLSPQ